MCIFCENTIEYHLKSPLFVHIFPTNAFFYQIVETTMGFKTSDFPPSGEHHKMIEMKFSVFFVLRYVSRCFHFGVFEIFVSSLFLLVVLSFGEYGLSAVYIPKADSQEKLLIHIICWKITIVRF